MGHFTINLPDNKQGDVRWGKVKKVKIILSLLFRKTDKTNIGNEPETGYIVRVAPNDAYRLFKLKNGDWMKDPDGNIALNQEPLLSIKKAIIEKEAELIPH